MKTREDFAKGMQPYIYIVNGCKGICKDDVILLYGSDLYELIMEDPIRNKGSHPSFLYPWNVLDYLVKYQGII